MKKSGIKVKHYIGDAVYVGDEITLQALNDFIVKKYCYEYSGHNILKINFKKGIFTCMIFL